MALSEVDLRADDSGLVGTHGHLIFVLMVLDLSNEGQGIRRLVLGEGHQQLTVIIAITVEATLDNEDSTLKPEMSVKLRVTRTVIDNAIVVPRSAVVRDEAGTHVYVVERTDTTTVAEDLVSETLTRMLSSTDHFLVDRTYYAIVNPEAPGFSHPFLVTNQQHGPSQMSVGSEPAIYDSKDEAAAQLALQEQAFGKDHLHVVMFSVREVFE